MFLVNCEQYIEQVRKDNKNVLNFETKRSLEKKIAQHLSAQLSKANKKLWNRRMDCTESAANYSTASVTIISNERSYVEETNTVIITIKSLNIGTSVK